MLHVKLELVLVADDDAEAVELVLLLVVLHSECCEVGVWVPVGIELFLEYLFAMDVKGAPACVEVGEDLDGGDVAVSSVDVLELRVVLLV